MKILYELTRHNAQHKRVIEALLPLKPKSGLRKLYTLLCSNNEFDDHAAMMEIFGKRCPTAFSTLKRKMKEILLKSLIIQNLNYEGTKIRMKEIIESYRQTLAIKLLLYKKSTVLGLSLLEKEISKVIDHEFTESVLINTRLLAANYGEAGKSLYKYKKYVKLQNEYLKIYEIELKAQNYFHSLHLMRRNTVAPNLEFLTCKALEYFNDLEKDSYVNTFNYIYDKYRILAMYYEYSRKYEELIELTDNIYSKLQREDLRLGRVELNLETRKAWALIQLGKYDEVINLGALRIKEYGHNSGSWMRIAYYSIKGYLYLGKYYDSIKLMTKVFLSNGYQSIPSNLQELFQTLLGYIHLIVNAGLAGDPQKIKEKLPEFRLAKFLNNTPIYSKDKRGINVSILLMHVGFLLQRRNYDAILDRIDSLNAYASRYLRRDDTFRSNCMIKMVVKMAKAGFHPIKTERYTADLRKQLSEVSLAGSGDNIEIEVIPFEVLWEIMMKAIQPQPRQSRKR